MAIEECRPSKKIRSSNSLLMEEGMDAIGFLVYVGIWICVQQQLFVYCATKIFLCRGCECYERDGGQHLLIFG